MACKKKKSEPQRTCTIFVCFLTGCQFNEFRLDTTTMLIRDNSTFEIEF